MCSLNSNRFAHQLLKIDIRHSRTNLLLKCWKQITDGNWSSRWKKLRTKNRNWSKINCSMTCSITKIQLMLFRVITNNLSQVREEPTLIEIIKSWILSSSSKLRDKDISLSLKSKWKNNKIKSKEQRKKIFNMILHMIKTCYKSFNHNSSPKGDEASQISQNSILIETT